MVSGPRMRWHPLEAQNSLPWGFEDLLLLASTFSLPEPSSIIIAVSRVVTATPKDRLSLWTVK